MQYFLVVKECILVLMEIITIDIEKDDAADLDTETLVETVVDIFLNGLHTEC